jgi:Flp pilus assembly protein TadG
MNNSGSNKKAPTKIRRRRLERGQSAVELAVVVPILALLLVVSSDFARMFYVSVAVHSAARSGAQYGAQSVITAADITGMTDAAKLDGSNIANLSVTAKLCTCQVSTTVTHCGTGYCTNAPQATYVEVDTSAPFNTLLNFPGVPSSTTLSSQAILQVEQ